MKIQWNFKDRECWLSLTVIAASIAGLRFPEFVQYIFILALIVGLGGLGYWVLKNMR